MKEFIKSLFTGVNGSISTKRFTLFALLFTFLTVCFVNLFYGKMLFATIQEQLFYLIIYALAAVFGEPAVHTIKQMGANAFGGSGGGTGPGGERPKDPPPNP